VTTLLREYAHEMRETELLRVPVPPVARHSESIPCIRLRLGPTPQTGSRLGRRAQRVGAGEVKSITLNRFEELIRDNESLGIPSSHAEHTREGALKRGDEEWIVHGVNKGNGELRISQFKIPKLRLEAQSTGRGANDLFSVAKRNPIIQGS